MSLQVNRGLTITISISLCLLISSAAVQCAFSFGQKDLDQAQRLSDAFSPSSTDQANYLTLIQNLVAAKAMATIDQRNTLRNSIADARFAMPSIRTNLDTVMATLGPIESGGTGSVNSSGSTATGNSVSYQTSDTTQLYSDRVKAFAANIDQFVYKPAAQGDWQKFIEDAKGLVNDRGGSFSIEREQLKAAMTRANTVVFRTSDSSLAAALNQARQDFNALKPQLDNITFSLKWAWLQQLYNRYTPLSDLEKQRVIKQIQDLASTASAEAKIDEYNGLRDFIDFASSSFFANDSATQDQLKKLLDNLPIKDPLLDKPFTEILATLKSTGPTTTTADAFMTTVTSVVKMRYGNKPGDDVNKTANKTALVALLTSMRDQWPQFSSYSGQISVLLAQVQSDSVSATVSSYSSRLDWHEAQVIEVAKTLNSTTKTVDAAKLADFMSSLKSLVNDRYGIADADKNATQLAANKSRLLRLIQWLQAIDWMAGQKLVLDQYAALATAGQPGTTSASTTGGLTSSGAVALTVFSVTFGDIITIQLDRVAGSIQFATSANGWEQFELLLLSLYDVVLRKAFARTDDVNRMITIADAIKTAANSLSAPPAYAGFCDFIKTLVSTADVSSLAAQRSQALLDMVSRVVDIPAPSDSLQAQFLKLGQSLVDARGALIQAQKDQFSLAMNKAINRGSFRTQNIATIQTMLTQFATAPADTTGTTSTTGSTTSTTGATTTQSGTATTTTPATTTPIQTSADQAAAALKSQADARASRAALLRSRIRSRG